MAGAGELVTLGGSTRTAGTMTATLFKSEVEFSPDAVVAPNTTFDEFLSQYQAELYGYAWQLTGKRADADDLYQETMLEASRSFDPLDGAACDRAWLYRIATSTYLNGRHRSGNGDDGAAEPAASLDARDLVSEVTALVDSLPAKQRVALVLRKYQRLDYDEIAVSLDTSESAARADVHQAYRTLRECFRDRL
jgi:RNA polymerase sigma-70 factor, ECF subfamily